jgi:hypothetical protein
MGSCPVPMIWATTTRNGRTTARRKAQCAMSSCRGRMSGCFTQAGRRSATAGDARMGWEAADDARGLEEAPVVIVEVSLSGEAAPAMAWRRRRWAGWGVGARVLRPTV